jgi:hypothetical protein
MTPKNIAPPFKIVRMHPRGNKSGIYIFILSATMSPRILNTRCPENTIAQAHSMVENKTMD